MFRHDDARRSPSGRQPDERIVSQTEPQPVEAPTTPAWRRATQGEHRWAASAAVVFAVGLQSLLPAHLAVKPRWLIPVIATLLLVALIVGNPGRLSRRSKLMRICSLALIACVSAANIYSVARLIDGLLHGTEERDAAALLLHGGAIWLTNVVVFGVWYWEFDRGGPVARALGDQEFPDLLFPQMVSVELAPAHWEPEFVDYLYLSFTNATAFSPTDVMPLSRWAKMTMLIQSLVSLSSLALVIARAVNILK